MTVVEDDGQDVNVFLGGGEFQNSREAQAPWEIRWKDPNLRRIWWFASKLLSRDRRCWQCMALKTLEDLRRNNRVRHSRFTNVYMSNCPVLNDILEMEEEKVGVTIFARTDLNTVCTRMARKVPCRFCSYGETDIMMGVRGVLGLLQEDWKMLMLFFWTGLMAFAVSTSTCFSELILVHIRRQFRNIIIWKIISLMILQVFLCNNIFNKLNFEPGFLLFENEQKYNFWKIF